VRARETANLACRSLDSEPEIVDSLSGGFEREDAMGLLAGAGADDAVLLVGHEPDFSQLVHDLTGGQVDVKKGGVAGIRLGRGRGELLTLLRPAELRLIASEPA
jgi:phosphohistidine phosphatase